jgi:hypothetical protein
MGKKYSKTMGFVAKKAAISLAKAKLRGFKDHALETGCSAKQLTPQPLPHQQLLAFLWPKSSL